MILVLTDLHRASTVLKDTVSTSRPRDREGVSLSYLRNQHLVSLVHAHGNPLAVLVEAAGADGQHLGLVQLLDAALGEEDAAGRPRLGLDALDQDPVQERDEGLDALECGRLCRAMLAYIQIKSSEIDSSRPDNRQKTGQEHWSSLETGATNHIGEKVSATKTE
jgi:hypothetical protein